MRPLIRGEGLTVAFGPQRVLHEAAFQVLEGERVALVGDNGSGKTTTIRVLLGALKPDTGAIERAPDLKVAHLPQIRDPPAGTTASDLLAEPSLRERQLQAEATAAEARMADPKFYEEPDWEIKLQRYGEIQTEMAQLKAARPAAGLSSLHAELGVTDEMLHRDARTLSGGELTKALLGHVLGQADRADLLVLDEPTNHLDLDALELVEDLLLDARCAILLTAHDQRLLDVVASRVLEVADQKLWTFDGNYSDYLEQRTLIESALEARRRKLRKEYHEQVEKLNAIRKRLGWSGQVAARRKMIQRIQEQEIPESKTRTLALRFEATDKSSQDVLHLQHVRIRRGEREVLQDATLEIRKGAKVGLVGPNGAGKSTVLRLVVGELKADKGKVEVAPGVRVGFFDQQHATLDPQLTVLGTIRNSRPDLPQEEARALLGRFLFKGRDQDKQVAHLSGGESARLQLATFMVQGTNLLVLDEPTNHLDIPAQRAIADALRDYPATVLVTSHHRAFLDACTTHTALLAHGGLKVWPGAYSSVRFRPDFVQHRTAAAPVVYRVRDAFVEAASGTLHDQGETLALPRTHPPRAYREALAEGLLVPA